MAPPIDMAKRNLAELAYRQNRDKYPDPSVLELMPQAVLMQMINSVSEELLRPIDSTPPTYPGGSSYGHRHRTRIYNNDQP